MSRRCTFLINKRNSRRSSPSSIAHHAGFTRPGPYIFFLGKGTDRPDFFRKGNKSAESNNHSISLTTILCKMCEHIVYCALSISPNVTSSPTHKMVSAKDLVTPNTDLVSGSEEKDYTDPILLDFTKAFDKVTSCLLQHQIEHYDSRCHTLH